MIQGKIGALRVKRLDGIGKDTEKKRRYFGLETWKGRFGIRGSGRMYLTGNMQNVLINAESRELS